jgi:hypothetical protein
MSFFPWFLWPFLILSFLMTAFIIISVLFKEYHGWKTYFTLLLTANILIICLVFAWMFYIKWDSARRHIYVYDGIGMEFLVVPLTLIPLFIYDLILVLPYFFSRHHKNRINPSPHAILITAICLLFILIMIALRIFF